MCHVRDRKQASRVYQFQNIEDLQFAEPPMSIPGMPVAGAVDVELDVVISAVFVTIFAAFDVVIASVAIMMVLDVGLIDGTR